MEDKKLTSSYKILTSSSPSQLTVQVMQYLEQGWKTVGGHSVVETKHQPQYSGKQHMRTIISHEYSQTIIKE